MRVVVYDNVKYYYHGKVLTEVLNSTNKSITVTKVALESEDGITVLANFTDIKFLDKPNKHGY